MSDPLEKMNRFGTELGTEARGVPMPLTAAEVRRQGDRRRRRSNAVRAGVAVLAVAAVAVPLGMRLDHDRTIRPTDPSQVATGVGAVNVLADAETVWDPASPTYRWLRTTSEAGEPGDGVTPCAQETLGELGATTTYHRRWQLADTSGPLSGPATVDTLSETVASFGNAVVAQKTVARIAHEIAACALPDTQHYRANRPQVVDTGDPDDTAMMIETNFIAKPYRDEDGHFIQIGLVARGDRVAVLSLEVGGQDFNLAPPVLKMLPTAARRLDEQGQVPTTGALDESALVGARDVSFMAGTSFVQTYSGVTETQAAWSVCAQSPITAGLGATAGVQREFTAHSDETGEPADAYLGESIGEWPSAARASAAAQTITDWYTRCRPSGSDHVTVAQPWRDVPTGTSATARQLVLQYGPADASPGSQFDVSGRTDLSWYVDVSVITDGDRVAVLTQNVLLVDYDTETAVTSTADDVPVAARRLQGSTDSGVPPTDGTTEDPTGPTNAAGVRTTIPDDYPLAAGWDTSTAEGPDSVLPPSRDRDPGELGACGRTAGWGDPVDQMTAAFHNPEDSRDRTLTTYADADAAVAATRAIVAVFQACDSEPGQPDGYVHHYRVSRTDVSGDSWHISAHYTYNGDPALGLTDIQVIRVGLAVLVLSHTNEGSEASIGRDVRTMTQQAEQPIADLCRFAVAGC